MFDLNDRHYCYSIIFIKDLNLSMLTEVMPIKKKSILPDNSFLHMLYILQHFKGALSGLRQFLVTEIPLRMMTSAFYFTLKAQDI